MDKSGDSNRQQATLCDLSSIAGQQFHFWSHLFLQVLSSRYGSPVSRILGIVAVQHEPAAAPGREVEAASKGRDR